MNKTPDNLDKIALFLEKVGEDPKHNKDSTYLDAVNACGELYNINVPGKYCPGGKPR